MGRVSISKEKTLLAIKGSGGVISNVARRLRVSWHTAKKYVDKWKDTKVAFEAEAETVLDLAEKNIVTSIKKGNIDSSKWYLSRKGRERGYSDRQELDHTTKGERINLGPVILKDNGRDG